jgi:hypothetical protein
MVCVFGIARVHAPTKTIGEILGAEPIGFGRTLVATTMGALSAIPFAALEDAIERHWPRSATDRDQIVHALASISHGARTAGAALSLVVLPIAFELFFRGAIFSTAAVTSRAKSAVGLATFTYALFFVASGDAIGIQYLPLTCAVGAMCSVARAATGSLLGAVGAAIAYYAVDAAITFRAFGTLDPLVTHVSTRTTTPVSWVVGAAIGALACAAILWRAIDDAPTDAHRTS